MSVEQSGTSRFINKYLASIITLVAVVALVYFWFANFEQVTEDLDLGFGQEARRNPYLAATLFLSQTGTPTFAEKGLEKLDSMPNVSDTLIIFSSRLVLSERRQKELKDWVENGGHLITTAQAYYNLETESSNDPLLNELGLQRYKSEELRKEETSHLQEQTDTDYPIDKSDEEPEQITEQEIMDLFYHANTEKSLRHCSEQMRTTEVKDCKDDIAKSLTRISFESVNDPLYAYLDTDFHLYDASEEAIAMAGSEFGTHLVQYNFGSGTITVLTSDNIWRNSQIDWFDHAYLLWLLTKDSEQIWLLYEVDINHWIGLFWKNAPHFIISASLFLLLWIWYRAYRFGPILTETTVQRRRLMEHIEANARFSWQHDLKSTLVASLREEIYHLADLKQTGFTNLTQQDQIKLIQKWTDTNQQTIRDLMWNQNPHKETDFINLCQQLQSLRNKL